MTNSVVALYLYTKCKAHRTSIGCAGLPNIKHSNSCCMYFVHIFHYRCWKSYRSPGADQWIHLKEEAYDITIWSYFIYKKEDGGRFTELNGITSSALRDCTYVGLQTKWQNVCTYTCRVKEKCHESHVNVDQFSCQKLTFWEIYITALPVLQPNSLNLLCPSYQILGTMHIQ